MPPSSIIGCKNRSPEIGLMSSFVPKFSRAVRQFPRTSAIFSRMVVRSLQIGGGGGYDNWGQVEKVSKKVKNRLPDISSQDISSPDNSSQPLGHMDISSHGHLITRTIGH